VNFDDIDHLTPQQQDQLVTETVNDFNQYLNRWPEAKSVDSVVEWSGEGCLIRDVRGREFIDCLGGFGIFALGHRHPKVIAAMFAE